MGLPAERQEIIRQTLSSIHDPAERLSVATSWKTSLLPLSPEDRSDRNLVRGCVSRVWLKPTAEGSQCRFGVDAESHMVGGLVRLLCWLYDGASPSEILAEEPIVLEETGLLRNLSPTRRNGLAAVRRAIIDFASRQP